MLCQCLRHQIQTWQETKKTIFTNRVKSSKDSGLFYSLNRAAERPSRHLHTLQHDHRVQPERLQHVSQQVRRIQPKRLQLLVDPTYLVVVVLTLTHHHNTMQSMVAGQAPIVSSQDCSQKMLHPLFIETHIKIRQL